MLADRIEAALRFGRQSIFAYRALFAWLSPRDYLLLKIVEPISQIIFFSLLGGFAGRDPAYFALGNAVRVAAASGLYGCSIVMGEERLAGTLQAVTAAATPLAQTFIARNALQGVDGTVTTVIGLAVGAWLFGLDFSQVNWLWLALALLITSYAISGLGILIATLGLIGTDLNLAMNLGYTSLVLFCGANFPVTDLPPVLQIVANVLPLTHGLAAIRLILVNQLATVPTLLLIEAGIGLAYAVAGYLLFRYVEYSARVHGTLDLV